MSEEKEQILETVNKIQEVVDLFYQQNDKEALEKFAVTIEDMIKAIDNLAAYKAENAQFEMDEVKIFNMLNEAMEAFQSDDKVLMADILQYDFIECISELAENVE